MIIHIVVVFYAFSFHVYIEKKKIVNVFPVVDTSQHEKLKRMSLQLSFKSNNDVSNNSLTERVF